MGGTHRFVIGIALAIWGCSADDLTEGSTGSTSTGGGAGGTGAGPGAGGGSCAGDEVCIPSAPSGWEGPFAVASGPTGSVPMCGAGYTMVQKYDAGDVAGDVTCEMCSCGAVTGAQCASLTVTAYSGTGCSGTPNALTFDGSQPCQSTGIASPFAHSLQTAAPAVSGQASCPASGGMPTKGAVTWTEEVLVCAADGGGACSGGGVCLPALPSGFPKAACVTSEGSAMCPDGFPLKSTAYSSFTDTRECTLCDCQRPMLTCSADVHGFLGAGCTGASTTIPTDSTCPSIPVGQPGWQSAQAILTLGGGGCTAMGGDPMGDVAPGTEVTICCTALD